MFLLLKPGKRQRTSTLLLRLDRFQLTRCAGLSWNVRCDDEKKPGLSSPGFFVSEAGWRPALPYWT